MIPKRMIRDVIERDNGFCLLAGPFCVGEATVADHRANRGMGGSKVLNSPENLIAACSPCNGWKETAHSIELGFLIERGLRVLRAATVAETLRRCRETPIEDLTGEQWWLTADGRRVPANTAVPF